MRGRVQRAREEEGGGIYARQTKPDTDVRTKQVSITASQRQTTTDARTKQISITAILTKAETDEIQAVFFAVFVREGFAGGKGVVFAVGVVGVAGVAREINEANAKAS